MSKFRSDFYIKQLNNYTMKAGRKSHTRVGVVKKRLIHIQRQESGKEIIKSYEIGEFGSKIYMMTTESKASQVN